MKIAHGISQVILQKNVVTGMLFLAGWLIHLPHVAFGGMLGLVLATVVARVFKFEAEKIADGIYGYNGALVGIASIFYFGWSTTSALLLCLGCVATVGLQRLLIKSRIPPLTATFVVVAWGVLLLGGYNGQPAAGLREGWFAPLPENLWTAPLVAIGQIMFQENAVSGLLFLAGMAVSDRKAAASLLAGGVLGSACGLLWSGAVESVSIGLWGFNPALVAVALSDRGSWLRPVAGIVLAVTCTAAFMHFGWPQLTAPFVLATWVVLIVERRSRKVALS